MTGEPSRWAALVRWRNWRLPVKLAAVTAVPVLLALALGVLTVRGQVERAAVYERSDRLVILGDEVLALVAGLQAERDASARLLATGPAAAAELRNQHAAVDAALSAVRHATAELIRPSEAILARLAEADRRIERLRPLREQAGSSAEPRLDAVAAIDEYGAIVGGLLELDRALVSDIADAELARTATALHDLTVATDQLYLQQDLVAVAAARGSMAPAELNALRASHVRLADKLNDFAAVASAMQLDDHRRTVAGTAVEARDQQLRRLLDNPDAPLPAAADWDAASGATIGLTTEVAGRLDRPLREASAALQFRASNRAGVASVILFAALVLAAGVGVAITRQLLGSLGTLRRTALEVADRQLPAAVATIRDGGLPDTAVRPVPVQTTEDVGQLARAFDAVHRQALRLAADEAVIRTGYSSVFVNLSRRSQGLVQRQLQLLERLERDEEDAEQLATLFQLDHLATRMRRNNENLMVLSGSDLARRTGEPTALVDLLRAAISEIEHYQRVELRPPPALQVVGHASGDLVRLIAELLDNATAFSPPDSPVTVAAHRSDSGSLVVNVLDQGIGMSDEEIAAANARLRDTGAVDVPASRRMGLFVVGRLAGRHGFEVRLHGGRDLQGVQATITVPPELVVALSASDDSSAPLGHPVPQGVRLPVVLATELPRVTARSAAPAGELPTRTGGINGSSRHAVLAGAARPAAEPALDEWPSWWDAAQPVAHSTPPVEETTPIFDQMVSAWFAVPDGVPSRWPNADPDGTASTPATTTPATTTPATPAAPTAAAGGAEVTVSRRHATPAAGRWESAADGGWQAARALAATAPGEYTAAGLPKRNPRQSLLPGSVAVATQDSPPVTTAGRYAQDLRDRLSSLRDGLSRGRHSTEEGLAGSGVGTDGPLAGSSIGAEGPLAGSSIGAEEPSA